MNSYNIDEIAIAQLIVVNKDGGRSGYKNIIGIPIYVNDKCFFYSILDDCFFRGTLFRSEEKLNMNEIYASIYDTDFGKRNIKRNLMRNGVEKTTITKEEIISGGFDLLSAYLSDLDYIDIKTSTNVDYRDLSNLEKNLIINELQYEQILDRPIMYTDGTVPPSNKKRLIRN